MAYNCIVCLHVRMELVHQWTSGNLSSRSTTMDVVKEVRVLLVSWLTCAYGLLTYFTWHLKQLYIWLYLGKFSCVNLFFLLACSVCFVMSLLYAVFFCFPCSKWSNLTCLKFMYIALFYVASTEYYFLKKNNLNWKVCSVIFIILLCFRRCWRQL